MSVAKIETVSNLYIGHDSDYTYITLGNNAKLADNVAKADLLQFHFVVGTTYESESDDNKFRVQNLNSRMTSNSSRPAANSNSVFSDSSKAKSSGTINVDIWRAECPTEAQFENILKYGVRVFNKINQKKWYIKSATVDIWWDDGEYPSIGFTESPYYKKKSNTFKWKLPKTDLTINSLVFTLINNGKKTNYNLPATATSIAIDYTALVGNEYEATIKAICSNAYHSSITYNFASRDAYLYYSKPTIASPAADANMPYGSSQTVSYTVSATPTDLLKSQKLQMLDKNGSSDIVTASTTGTVAAGITMPTAEYTATTDGLKARVMFEYLDGHKEYSAWVPYGFTYETPSTSNSIAYYGDTVSLAWATPAYRAGISNTEVQQNNYNQTGTATVLGTSTGVSYSYNTANYKADKSGFSWRPVFKYKNGYQSIGSWKTVSYNYATPSAHPGNGTSLVHGGIYTFNWSASGTVSSVSGISLKYNNYNGTGTTAAVSLANGTTQYSMDTSKVSDKTGMSWSLTFTFDNGQTTTTGTMKLPFTAPSVTVNDLRPSSGNVFRGFTTTFSWEVAVTKPASLGNNVLCTGINCAQTSAVFRWQKVNDTANHDTTITGSGKTKPVDDSTMTVGGSVYVGAFRWCIVVNTTLGYSFTSGWVNLTYFEIPISISNLLPATGARAVKVLSNQFAWTFEPSGNYNPPQPITQKSAVIYWRPTGGSWRSVNITGAQASYTFPANTFSGSEIQWYVAVTASTGTQATGAVQTVSTLDDVSYPVAVDPAGEFKDSASVMTFSWKHIISTGTLQTAAVLEYSTDSGLSYQQLATVSGSAASVEIAAGTFQSGTIYWRVKTANSDGTYGSYSAVAIFVASKDPDAPMITYTSGSAPLPVLRWQSSEQVGFELMIDGEPAGTFYGTDKEWKSGRILADGEHTVMLRILDKYDKRSGWSSITLPVANSYDEDTEKVTMTVVRQFGQVRVDYALTGSYSMAYLLRDGELIAKDKAAAGFLIDRCSVGWHTYKIRAIKTDGNYVDSPELQAAPRVPYGCIGLLDGDSWHLLKLTSGKEYVSRTRQTATGSFIQYYGRSAPVYDNGGDDGMQEVLTVSYIVTGIDMSALASMLGKEVVYKDFKGNLIKGVFTSLPQSQRGNKTAVTISITGTDTEAVEYEPV